MKISRKREDIINNAQSRYAPALTLVNIKQILDSSNERYVFIGKPCDIAGVKNLIDLYPDYRGRFVLFISIFCAGMPSYNATEKTWKLSGREDAPINLKYRGEGWPGDFKATWEDGQEFRLSYHDSWGKILGRQLGFRCKICPDGIGMLADVAVGDSWNTKDGYPDFTDAKGRCFVFVRTELGQEVMSDACKSGYIEYHNLDVDRIKEMQAYQHSRRKLVGWRLLPVKIATIGLIDFKGLGIGTQAKNANLNKGIKNMIGSIKRIYNVIWGG
jgi:coenzyme F420 hydrogenase subunit beta